MYLEKKTYVKNWDHHRPEDRWAITVLKGGQPSHIKTERISYIVEEVGYWRKANAIHQWFVNNCQEGVDDCRSAYVAREQLRELLAEVEKVLAHPESAEDRLPTASGFFFGSTAYDEYYWEDLEKTKGILETALAEGDNGDFYYSSSW